MGSTWHSGWKTMRYEIRIDSSRGLCRVRFTGAVEPSELEAFRADFRAALDATPAMPTLYDLRQASLDRATASQMRQLGAVNASLSEWRGASRLALLVGDDLSFGLMRMYEVLGASPNLRIQVFRDEREAEEWAADGSAP